MSQQILYLSRADVEGLDIPMSDVIEQTALAFAEKGHGRALMPAKHWIAFDNGRFFSAMSGALPGIDTVVCKWQSGYHANSELGLPFITGVLVLNRLEDGLPVAIMDSTWITAKRTAAATAVTSRHLSTGRPETVAIIGCGVQGRSNVEALACVHPELATIRAFDIDPRALDSFAADMGSRFGLSVVPCASAEAAMPEADIVVTCGPIAPGGNRSIKADWLKAGSLLVTLDYDCYLANDVLHSVDSVFTDDVEQLRHLADYGFFLDAPEVIGEIGTVVAGAHPGRAETDLRVIAINMGIALEDAAVARRVYERAMAERVGVFLDT